MKGLSPLNTNTVEKKFLKVVKHSLLTYHAFDQGNERKVTLVTGFATWDLLADDGDSEHSVNFVDHLIAVREFITQLKKMLVGTNVDVYWRLPMAVHLHVLVNVERGEERNTTLVES